MAHHEGFLRDIIEHPEDDAPRLIYADWLDEHGQAERGEFIRVQCALAAPPWRVGRVYDDPAWLRLHAREREQLSASHALDWGPDRALWDAGFDRAIMTSWESGESLPPGYAGTLFRRGFVAEVTLPCGQWMRHGRALVRAAPLERVNLSDRQPSRWYRLGWGEWYWVRQAGPTLHISDRLPPELCDLLSTGRVDEDGIMTYPSREAALDALSSASLKWARNPVPAPH